LKTIFSTKNKMKILIITYLFPPIWEAQSIRWYYIAKSLTYLGCSVDILTVNPFLEKRNIDIKANIERIPPGLFEYFLFKFKRNLNLENEESKTIRTKFFFKFLKKLYRLNRRIFENLFLGDIRIEWFLNFIFYYYKTLRHKVSYYDYIICAHEPIVDILIALFLKKLHPQINLVVDIADPLTADYYPKFWKPVLQKIENTVLHKSDLVLVTNELIKKKYIEKYHVNPEKLIVITQGFDEKLIKDCYKQKRKNRNKTLNLFYAGSFYSSRDPKSLFKVLRYFPNIRFYYAGRNENYLPKDLLKQEKIIYLGVLSHEEVLNIAKSMDILVYISNKNFHQTPGKIFEYLGLCKPILCIVYSDRDPIINLINDLKVGFIAQNKEEDIYKQLGKIINLWQMGKLDLTHNFNADKVKRFSWQFQTKKLLRFISNQGFVSKSHTKS